MKTKLTVRLEDHVVRKAKEYAKEHKINLLKMIEFYLDSLTRNNKEEYEITPLVKSLGGVIDLPWNYDYKREYRSYIEEKYK